MIQFPALLPHRPVRRAATLVLLGLAAWAVSALLLTVALRYQPLVAGLFPKPLPVSDDTVSLFDWPGIRRPLTVSAAAAHANDDEPIIGISAGGQNRAYAVLSLSQGPKSHIINDLVGDVPVTVTYCNIYRCTRAFTEGSSAEPLELSQGGLRAGGMVVKCGGHAYRQDSGAALDSDSPSLPYSSYPSQETTWGQWRAAHPDTDLYGDSVLSKGTARVATDPYEFNDPIPWLLIAELSFLPLSCTLLALSCAALLRRRIRPRTRLA